MSSNKKAAKLAKKTTEPAQEREATVADPAPERETTVQNIASPAVRRVRLGPSALSFFDPSNGLTLAKGEAKEVKKFTPLTKLWLRSGGLVEIKGER